MKKNYVKAIKKETARMKNIKVLYLNGVEKISYELLKCEDNPAIIDWYWVIYDMGDDAGGAIIATPETDNEIRVIFNENKEVLALGIDGHLYSNNERDLENPEVETSRLNGTVLICWINRLQQFNILSMSSEESMKVIHLSYWGEDEALPDKICMMIRRIIDISVVNMLSPRAQLQYDNCYKPLEGPKEKENGIEQ